MSNVVHHAKGWVDSSQEKLRAIIADNKTSLPQGVRKSLLEVYEDLHRAEACLRMKENET